MKAVLPTRDEVAVIVRAIEGGAFDAAAKDWCCGRPSRAVRALVPAVGRLVGHPLSRRSSVDANGERWAGVREALKLRYWATLGAYPITGRAVLIYAGDRVAIDVDDVTFE